MVRVKEDCLCDVSAFGRAAVCKSARLSRYDQKMHAESGMNTWLGQCAATAGAEPASAACSGTAVRQRESSGAYSGEHSGEHSDGKKTHIAFVGWVVRTCGSSGHRRLRTSQ